jgi:serine phosphatase RsbU (regulator of sigma subunit)
MSSRRWVALIAGAFAAAIAVSALLYRFSRSADFDRHSQVVEAVGQVRHLDRLLSEQVLAARFGLLNQYDSINATEAGLAAADGDLESRIRDVGVVDSGLEPAFHELEEAIAAKRAAAERFKTENSILRNSTYYLPTAANETVKNVSRSPTKTGRATDKGSDAMPVKTDAVAAAIQRVAQTGLAYNLIGDESSRDAHLQAIAALRAQEQLAPVESREALRLLVAHANAIAREVPAVDRWVQAAVSTESAEKLSALESEYQTRFARVVASSNRYRQILYAWSLFLLAAVGVTGVQLRRAYTGLELRVAERTSELRDALAALWGEMKLARKIQEALVPTAPSLSRCEIAARMQATDEVGGDYYDVIQMEGCEWILIGDVSGHGVPAGLVMMMCHTAVRTVLGSVPEAGPDVLLSRVNSVLTRNIRELNEDKYMTISAFRRSPDGTVRFAGAHQDVYIFRAATGRIERLESSGVWLGLKDEIGSVLAVQEFHLEPDDLLFLHTDGVTEATRDGVMFEREGIMRILQAANGKTAAQVVDETFAELLTYDVKDDATVVVLKQLHPWRGIEPDHST